MLYKLTWFAQREPIIQKACYKSKKINRGSLYYFEFSDPNLHQKRKQSSGKSTQKLILKKETNLILQSVKFYSNLKKKNLLLDLSILKILIHFIFVQNLSWLKHSWGHWIFLAANWSIYCHLTQSIMDYLLFYLFLELGEKHNHFLNLMLHSWSIQFPSGIILIELADISNNLLELK